MNENEIKTNLTSVPVANTELSMLRHISNYIVRSSLYSINAEKFRDVRETREVVCSDSNFRLEYDGYRLGQDDFDLFQVVSNLWYLNEKQEHLYLSKYELANCLKKVQAGKTYQNLMLSVDRLARCIFVCYYNEYKFVGALLTYVEHTSGKLKFSFNQELMNLLAIDNKSFQDYEIRRNLNGDLTKWLYNFYSTHSQTQYHTLDHLKQYCGATSEDRKFKLLLKKSLEQLLEKEIITSFEFKKGETLSKTIDVVKPKQIKPQKEVIDMLENIPQISTKITTKPKAKVVKSTGRGRVAL